MNFSSHFVLWFQILRSVAGWSSGVKRTEKSIHTAYLDCIERAKHYIYIEVCIFIQPSISYAHSIGQIFYKHQSVYPLIGLNLSHTLSFVSLYSQTFLTH